MLARLEINGKSWQVLNANHPLCSESEVWLYNKWQNWSDSSSSSSSASASSSRSRSRGAAPDVFFPTAVEHVLFPGCSHK
jgi:hypothetical protein